MPQAYIYKFANEAGDEEYVFPTNRYELSETQGLLAPSTQPAGTDFAYDHLGNSPAYRTDGHATIRLMPAFESFGEAEYEREQIKARLQQIGNGKLWLKYNSGELLWARGRIESVASIDTSVETTTFFTTICDFRRTSDWFEVDQEAPSGSHINSSPQTITITNPGNYPARRVVLRIRANGAGAWGTSLLIENLSNGQSIQVNNHAAAGANSEIKFDFSANSIVQSTDDGATYPTNLWPDTVLGDQKGLGHLKVGANSIRFTTASPDFQAEYSFYVPR